MIRKPAKRQIFNKPRKDPVVGFDMQKSVDMLDPGHYDSDGCRYIMVVLDHGTYWIEPYAPRSKSPIHTAAALAEDARRSGGMALKYRTDNGGE